MSDMDEAVKKFKQWFKDSGLGECKNPNFDPIPPKSNHQVMHILPGWYIDNPIYPTGRYQGD